MNKWKRQRFSGSRSREPVNVPRLHCLEVYRLNWNFCWHVAFLKLGPQQSEIWPHWYLLRVEEPKLSLHVNCHSIFMVVRARYCLLLIVNCLNPLSVNKVSSRTQVQPLATLHPWALGKVLRSRHDRFREFMRQLVVSKSHKFYVRQKKKKKKRLWKVSLLYRRFLFLLFRLYENH